ncbi:MAG: hypothetical protein A2V90_01900 [Gammaproteobacteria bacterium RBG_16_57_12]|nr:MAG: hypothetical protein A2V90_01900 [Gammaproteobacteria bacterium RBG_16_57_12]
MKSLNSPGEESPWRPGNHFELLIDGHHYFNRILHEIGTARSTIHIEIYLVRSGHVIDRFVAALYAAAERGVRVFVLLDDFGSRGLTEADRRRLIHPGIHIAHYNPLSLHNKFVSTFRLFLHNIALELHRDHRKVFIIDAKTAFVGGTGLTDDFDPPSHPENRWRENMVEIRGPVVSDWIALFADSWQRYSTISLPVASPDIIPPGHAQGRITINKIHQQHSLRHSLLSHIISARYRAWLATAYFVPSWKIRRTLCHAARRGVDVRLLLPGPISDHPAVRQAGRRFYAHLLRNGVRIFEYQPRFMHAKTVLCDDWSSIGSSNFDHWNLRWNLEANQEIICPDFCAQVHSAFENDYLMSHEILYKEWVNRAWYWRLLEGFWSQIDRLLLKIGQGNP